MKKSELVAALAERSGQTKAAAEAVLDALPGLLAEITVDEGVATLPGVGKIERRLRAARTVRNPRTGEAMEKPAATAVGFKPAKALKDAVAAGAA